MEIENIRLIAMLLGVFFTWMSGRYLLFKDNVIAASVRFLEQEMGRYDPSHKEVAERHFPYARGMWITLMVLSWLVYFVLGH